MLSLPLFSVFVATFLLVWFVSSRDKRRKGVKKFPGPRGLPIIGSGYQLAGKMQHEQFNKWTEEYGEIYQVMLGGNTTIVVSNPKILKEMLLNDPNYVGRPHFELFDIYENERLGIISTEGEMWEVHRRFLLRQLRDFGFGKSAMEGLILEELREVMASFKANEGKPIGNLKITLSFAVLNSLWTVVTCSRFQHDDPKLLKLVDSLNKVLSDIFETGGLLFILPWLKHIIPERSGYNKVRKLLDESKIWFEEAVEEHKKTFQDDNLRDFIDVYLAEVKKTTDPNSVFYGKRAERQLIATINDLFAAGRETTSTTISWAVLYLAKFPHIQKKFQQEIASVSNNSRSISVTDRPNMPYTLALIDEVLRYSSITPNGVEHRAMEGKEFQGYYIPKGAWISPNLHFMHHNPKVWGDPENFRPERFISADGKYVKSEFLIPFQAGRRVCPGETLARDTVFIFLTNIFQKFEVILDPNSPEATLEPEANFLLQPQPYSVIMKDTLSV